MDLVRQKLKINNNGRMEDKVARETRAIGALMVDQRERSKLFQETSIRRSLLGQLWW